MEFAFSSTDKSMDLFYTESVSEGLAILENEEFHHAVSVMRLRPGDTLRLTDGLGSFYEGQLANIDKRSASVSINQTEQVPAEPYNVSIGMAFTKNIKRVEWALEKMTELGIGVIWPMVTERSERARFNESRLQRILVAAMKQSQRAWLPRLIHSVSLDEMLQMSMETESQRLVCIKHNASRPVKDNYTPGNDVLMLIGPEGDFTDAELDKAIEAGFLPTLLGNYRLRTETAAVAAVAAIHQLNMK